MLVNPYAALAGAGNLIVKAGGYGVAVVKKAGEVTMSVGSGAVRYFKTIGTSEDPYVEIWYITPSEHWMKDPALKLSIGGNPFFVKLSYPFDSHTECYGCVCLQLLESSEVGLYKKQLAKQTASATGVQPTNVSEYAWEGIPKYTKVYELSIQNKKSPSVGPNLREVLFRQSDDLKNLDIFFPMFLIDILSILVKIRKGSL